MPIAEPKMGRQPLANPHPVGYWPQRRYQQLTLWKTGGLREMLGCSHYLSVGDSHFMIVTLTGQKWSAKVGFGGGFRRIKGEIESE